jgi:AraC-like DNA-binding protein
MLGYAELSALSRSCQRWFSCSPKELRRMAEDGHAIADQSPVDQEEDESSD